MTNIAWFKRKASQGSNAPLDGVPNARIRILDCIQQLLFIHLQNLKHPEDAATLKEGLNILMQLLSNVGKPNNEPTVNAARLLMESIVEALL